MLITEGALPSKIASSAACRSHDDADCTKLLQSGHLPSMEDIEETMQRNLTQLALLRQLRNAHIPILRLPPEILAHILLFCGLPSTQPHWSAHWTDAVKNLVRLTQVCSRWHSVAVSCSRLWATVSTMGRDKQLSFLLDRAKHAPLTVLVERPDSYYDQSKPSRIEAELKALQLLHHMPRIRLLELSAGHREWSAEAMEAIRLALSATAPHLEHILLKESGDIDEHLFADYAPRLQSMDVRKMKLKLVGWHPLQNMRDLALTELGDFNTPSQVLDMLHDAGRLQSLQLMHPFNADQVPRAEWLKGPINMVFLNNLSLKGPGEVLAGVLENLTVPALVKFTIVTYSWVSSNEVTRRILESSAVAGYLSRWSGTPGKPCVTRRTDLRIEHTTLKMELHCDRSVSTLSASFNLTLESDQPSTQALLETTVGPIVERLQTQVLNFKTMDARWFSPQGWSTTFPPGNSHRLRELDVEGAPAVALIFALGSRRDSDSNKPKRAKPARPVLVGDCLLPCLRKVALRNVHFRTSIGGSLLMTHLKQSLQARAAVKGVAQFRLLLCGCNGYTDADLDKLQALGATTVIEKGIIDKELGIPKEQMWA
jgi:hypothetical protein